MPDLSPTIDVGIRLGSTWAVVGDGTFDGMNTSTSF